MSQSKSSTKSVAQLSSKVSKKTLSSFHQLSQQSSYSFWQMLTFIFLLLLYLLRSPIRSILAWRLWPASWRQAWYHFFSRIYQRLIQLLELKRSGSIARLDLIELSMRNMRAKKTRTMVTIGGMTIGIAAIVFLVSIGYGLQQLVISRVVRLEEMKQADVNAQAGSKVKLNDQTLADLADLPAITQTLPLIAVVGRVNYQNSVSDVAVYGVTRDYLAQSAIKPIAGEIFASNDLSINVQAQTEKQTRDYLDQKNGELGQKIQEVEYQIAAETWVRVRENASSKAKILGYTKNTGTAKAEEIWGEKYPAAADLNVGGQTASGSALGKWLKAPVLLWQEKDCQATNEGDCEAGRYVVARDENGQQIQAEGYFAEIGVEIKGKQTASVAATSVKRGDDGLSKQTASASALAILPVQDDDNWVMIASEAASPVAAVKTLPLSKQALRQAVVNRAMLKVLGLDENHALGQKFTVSFVVVGELLADATAKIESAPSEYTIVGITPEEKTPVFYVPFIDLRSLGVSNYSQIKIVLEKQDDLAKTRKQIEAMGYVTRSVADTVAQINSLFASLRTFLALLGLIALAVAALGMFNTLTISLLERTREVGLMKAMGMKASEVRELFLTESMMMGFFGGVLGIALGFLLGELMSLFLSLFALFKGVGLIDITHLPALFILAVSLLALGVGVLTGIYPARRATKISALNALRYE